MPAANSQVSFDVQERILYGVVFYPVRPPFPERDGRDDHKAKKC